MEAKQLKYKQLNGISEKQLSEHHDVLYAGYVKKIQEIRQKLEAADRESANATSSDFRALKIEESFALNGVRLHELYFDNLGGDGKAKGEILKLIEADFGSLESWQKEFAACGMSARGWVILTYDWEERKLRNYVCDLHNQGGIWGASPLLVLDMYEHAYFIDFATAKKKYIEAFMSNVDWDEVNDRIKRHNMMEHRNRRD